MVFGTAGVDGHLQRHAPATLGVADHLPMRLHGHGLMDQLETAFRLANRFDGERTETGRLRCSGV